MAFPKKVKELCTPAFLYFTLSMFGILISVVQNLGNSRTYNLGMLTTRVPSTFLVFLVEIIYILFWTWVLNLMCKDGHKEIAWFLVLIPFILLFLLQGSMMDSREGFYQPTVGTNTNAKGNVTTTTQTTSGTNNATTDATRTTDKKGNTIITSKVVDPVTGTTTFSKNVYDAAGVTLENSSKTIDTPTN